MNSKLNPELMGNWQFAASNKQDINFKESVSKVFKTMFLQNFVIWPFLPPDPLEAVSKLTLAENHHCPVPKGCADFQRLSPFREGQRRR